MPGSDPSHDPATGKPRLLTALPSHSRRLFLSDMGAANGIALVDADGRRGPGDRRIAARRQSDILVRSVDLPLARRRTSSGSTAQRMEASRGTIRETFVSPLKPITALGDGVAIVASPQTSVSFPSSDRTTGSNGHAAEFSPDREHRK